jgi:hypothetical protein
MDPWPFEDEEWDEISELTHRLTNSTLADDQILHGSIHRELIERLCELMEKYGEHPVLLETLADFAEDPNERLSLYWKALKLSVKHEMPTLTIRIFLAELLIEEFQDAKEARQVLKDGEDEFLDREEEPEWVSKFAELWWQCRVEKSED